MTRTVISVALPVARRSVARLAIALALLVPVVATASSALQAPASPSDNWLAMSFDPNGVDSAVPARVGSLPATLKHTNSKSTLEVQAKTGNVTYARGYVQVEMTEGSYLITMSPSPTTRSTNNGREPFRKLWLTFLSNGERTMRLVER